MEDHHVDRPGVEAQQCAKLTGPNRSIGSITMGKVKTGTHDPHDPPRTAASPTKGFAQVPREDISIPRSTASGEARLHLTPSGARLCRPPGLRWLGGHSEGQNTRSHPELGRENPQRQWYCVLRRGRVGRRHAFKADKTTLSQHKHPVPKTFRGVEQPGSSSGS